MVADCCRIQDGFRRVRITTDNNWKKSSFIHWDRIQERPPEYLSQEMGSKIWTVMTRAIIKTIQIGKTTNYVSIQVIHFIKLYLTIFWINGTKWFISFCRNFCDGNHERNRRIKGRGQNKMVPVTWTRFLRKVQWWDLAKRCVAQTPKRSNVYMGQQMLTGATSG